jgi:hypothetical protein
MIYSVLLPLSGGFQLYTGNSFFELPLECIFFIFDSNQLVFCLPIFSSFLYDGGNDYLLYREMIFAQVITSKYLGGLWHFLPLFSAF